MSSRNYVETTSRSRAHFRITQETAPHSTCMSALAPASWRSSLICSRPDSIKSFSHFAFKAFERTPSLGTACTK
jgi:hypothetical protein